MNAEVILTALNGVDDRYITSYTPSQSESTSDNKQKRSVMPLWKWISVAACIALVICAIPVAIHFIGNYNAPDPYWHETHVQLTDQNEAIATFGDDLLLDRIIVPGVADSLYQEYILEHSGKDPADRSTWASLYCWLRYGAENYYEQAIAEVNISVYFSDNLARMVYNDFLNYHNGETVFGTIEINGFTVEYYSEKGIAFVWTSARFKYNGLDYSVRGKNYDLVMKTVRQMLGF